MDIEVNLLLAVTVPLASATLVGYLGKRAIDAGFRAGTKAFELRLQATHAQELERLRVELQATAFEYQTKFSRLHERRVEVFADLYRRIVDAYFALARATAPLQPGDAAPLTERLKESAPDIDDLILYFERNRIWLPAELCSQVEACTDALRSAYLDFSSGTPRDEATRAIYKTARETMDRTLPEIRQTVETHLRRSLDAPTYSPPTPSRDPD